MAALAATVPLAAADSRSAREPDVREPGSAPASPRAGLIDLSPTGRDPEPRREGRSPAPVAAPNPLAPFLERWLAGGKPGAREAARPGAPGTRAGERTTLAPAPAPRVVPPMTPGAPAAAANPYVAAMEETERLAALPSTPTEAAPAVSPAPASRPPSANEETRVVVPTLTAPEAPERPVDPTYRPPPSRDAKYFPQQKRF